MDELIRLIGDGTAVRWIQRSASGDQAVGVIEIGGRTIRIALHDLGPIPPAAGSEIAT